MAVQSEEVMKDKNKLPQETCCVSAAEVRQPATVCSSLVQVGDLVLNCATREVFRGRREINLTATEFRLLEALMRRPGGVITRDALVEAVWGLTPKWTTTPWRFWILCFLATTTYRSYLRSGNKDS